MYTIVRKGILKYKIGDNNYINVGTLTKEIDDKYQISYVFDIDKKELSKVSEYEPLSAIMIPALDLDNGYNQRFIKTPYFIQMRIFDKRRQDIDELLDMVGLKYYDQFEVMLKLKGKSIDRWECHEAE